jgi:hypothetical protein
MESRTKLEEDPKEIPQARLSYEYVEITKWSNVNPKGRKFMISVLKSYFDYQKHI